jgi:hypothetical protein
MQQKEINEEEKNLIKKILIKPIITQKSKKMTLKELQSMIKEEFEAFTNEAEDELDVSVSDADVDVDAEMGDEMADAGEEDVLRNIYDLLAAHFGEGEEDIDMGDEMPMDDAEGEEAPDSDLDEVAAAGFGDKGNKASSGANAGYTPAKTTKGSTGYDAGSKALQERFQKLANIIK